MLISIVCSQGCRLAKKADNWLPGSILFPQDEPLTASDSPDDGPHAVAEPAPAGTDIDRLGLDPVQALLQRCGYRRLGAVQAVELVRGYRIEVDAAHVLALALAPSPDPLLGVLARVLDLGLQRSVRQETPFKLCYHDRRLKDEGAVALLMHQVAPAWVTEACPTARVGFYDLVSHRYRNTLLDP